MRLRSAAAALVATVVGTVGLVVAPVSTAAPAPAADGPSQEATAAAEEGHDGWFTSWTQSIQRRSGLTFTDRTLRQVSRLTQGGDQVRLRLENTFGTAPMVVDHTTIGRTGTGAGVVAGTMRTVLFDGAERVSVPAGGSVWSDPLDFATVAQQDVTISFYVRNATVTTLHDRAGRTNWFAPNNGGNVAASESGAAFTETHGWSYIVGAVDVHNEDLAGTVVAYGSSVVDGSGSESCGAGCTEPDPYMRWTDMVSRRIAAELPADRQLALVNAGIGGTTASPACGSGGLDGVSRLSRDVLSLHGVTAVVYYYGTNDIANLGTGCSAEALVSSMRATFAELRAAGIDVLVTPVTPRPGFSAVQNARRAEVNAFIRGGGDCSGTCDHVVDFDAALRDPANPNAIRPEYDYDGLHVNTRGQRALADTVPLAPLVAAGAAAFTTPPPTAATLGRAYSYRLGASGRPAPRFAVTRGALPAGLALDAATGVVSGVPTQAGRHAFTVEARNAAGVAVQDAVVDVVSGPAFTNGTPPAATVGTPYEHDLQVSGHPAPTFTVVQGELPEGLRLDPATGRLSGTPVRAGAAVVTVRAANGVAADATTTFTLDVVAAPSSTVLTLGETSVRYGAGGTVARVVVFATGASPQGAVQLHDGSAVVGQGTLVADEQVPGVSVARVPLGATALRPGVHRLSASYAGDDRVRASGDVATVTVAKAAARVTAQVRDPGRWTSARRGQVDVTVRASGVRRPGGRVVVRVGGRTVGSARVGNDGSARITLSPLRAGRHALTVGYGGSATVAPATGPTLAVVVRRR